MFKDTEGHGYYTDLMGNSLPMTPVRVVSINKDSHCAAVCMPDGTRRAITLWELAGHYRPSDGKADWQYFDSADVPLVEYKDAMPGYTGKGER